MQRGITEKLGYDFEDEIIERIGPVSFEAIRPAFDIVSAGILGESREIDSQFGTNHQGNEVDEERHYLAETLTALDRALIAFEDAVAARAKRLALTVPARVERSPLDDDAELR